MTTAPVRWAPTPPLRHPRRLHPVDLVVAILLGAVLVAAWPALLAVRGPTPAQLTVVTAHEAGMLAGYGVLVLIGLMSRAPVLERDVGADVLARWHARGGRIVLGLVLLHAWAAVAAWSSSRHEGALTASWHVLRMPQLMAASVGTLLLVAIGVVSARAARRRMSWETWHLLHLLTYLAVALSFLHMLAGPDLAGHRLVQIAWALLYTHVFALVLRYRVLTPLRQAIRHRLRVSAVVVEGPGVVSIIVQGQHLHELRAESGQFLRWRFLTPDHWLTAHPFSLSAPPTDTHLRLTVKALGNGSGFLQALEVGTWVVAEGPYGAMTAARRTRRNVLLVAGGVGITPMRALFETIPLAAGQQLDLLYRARSYEHVVFREEIEGIARRRGARVHYLLGSDRECLTGPGLLRRIPDLADRDVYLCGPGGMADATREGLRAAGLPTELLHEERFAF